MNTAKDVAYKADSLLTSYQVGALLQVNPSSVNKWVKDGRMPAFRTPGGHRRIRAGDLVAFLSAHKMPIPQSLTQAARRRILLVDTDTRSLEMAQRSLQAHTERLEVQTATNNIDALVQVGAFQPHLIILDANADGLEVCRRLHDSAHTQTIAVLLAAAGQPSSDLERRADEAGARAVVSKPVEAGLILRALGLSQEA